MLYDQFPFIDRFVDLYQYIYMMIYHIYIYIYIRESIKQAEFTEIQDNFLNDY